MQVTRRSNRRSSRQPGLYKACIHTHKHRHIDRQTDTHTHKQQSTKGTKMGKIIFFFYSLFPGEWYMPVILTWGVEAAGLGVQTTQAM